MNPQPYLAFANAIWALDLSPACKLTLLALAKSADLLGCCKAAAAWLRLQQTGMETPTIQDSLGRLRAAGLAEAQEVECGGYEFVLHVEPITEPDPPPFDDEPVWGLAAAPAMKLMLLAMARLADAGGCVTNYEGLRLAFEQTGLGEALPALAAEALERGRLTPRALGGGHFGYALTMPAAAERQEGGAV